jgi:complement component 1 Q subcomponent-binding protein
MFRTALRLAAPRLSVSARVAPRIARALPAVAPVRAFSVSLARCGSGETDAELSSRLAQEISYERQNESSPDAAPPAFVSDFQAAGIWKIEDVAGSDEIALTRSYGNEKIRVLFSIGDIDTSAPEHDEIDAEEANHDDGEPDVGFPVRCAITISKVSEPRRHPRRIYADTSDAARTRLPHHRRPGARRRVWH